MMTVPIILFLSICTPTDDCIYDINLTPDDGPFLSVQECMVQGQEIIASYMREHPGYQIRRFSCGQQREKL